MIRALVTGGSRGIGAAIVREFAAGGMAVSFLYRQNREAAEALAKETGAEAICVDIADGKAVAKAIADAGHFDILVNNAGISSFSLLQELPDEEWERCIATDLSGTFYCTKAVLPGMISRKWGRIVNISSMWGIAGSACEVHYSAAKAGLIGFTKALAKEVGLSGITVNCVAPGVIDTDMNRGLGEDTLRALAEDTPVGRLGTPEEVAGLVAYLCSERAGFITGQVICQSGGLVI